MPDFKQPPPNGASLFADMRGHHVAVRAADYDAAIRWYVDVLDFRIVTEWSYGDQQLAFVAPSADDQFLIEILGGGAPSPRETRPYEEFGNSLAYSGYHHFCLNVASVDVTVEALRARSVTIVAEPFEVEAINRRIAFVADPFGNLIELAEIHA